LANQVPVFLFCEFVVMDSGFGFLAVFCSFGLLFRRRFFGLECYLLVSCLFFAVFRFVVFGGSWWLWGESVEFSGKHKGLMVVGEFLVFGKALLTLRVRR